ncbi:cytoskeletal protein Syp1 [Schizosaccharomyces cryophilus OY26]|uniref:Cytoskeletal protein Syp1 n=1 Tax=Schizosaccharomyces cryophilus (strain OY26 / ATCC MYA-4695 / CBS 11777 / NBRC 106824 / NRRL Y48691) TaxID=653667 RepID=S9W616_SCHCR|nr:cytoskeletal protein Syp1 [Schizosaccharomyces cryophilus OY26]EPY54004.1 cytoskeletal protein Syp1 [Schizosaccharomyces cryophilus OY26]
MLSLHEQMPFQVYLLSSGAFHILTHYHHTPRYRAMDSLTKTEYVTAFLSNCSPKDSMSLFRQKLEQVRSDNDVLACWIRERMEIEKQYSGSLHKLAMSMQNIMPQSISFSDAWKQLEAETLEIAKYRNQITHQLGSQIYKPVVEYYTSSPQIASLRELAERLTNIANELSPSQGLMKLSKPSKSDALHSRANWDAEAPLAFEKLQSLDEERLLILKQVYLSIASLESDACASQQDLLSKSMEVYMDLPIEDEIKKYSQPAVSEVDPSSTPETPNTPFSSTKEHGGDGKLKNRVTTLFRRKSTAPKKNDKSSPKSPRAGKLASIFNKKPKDSDSDFKEVGASPTANHSVYSFSNQSHASSFARPVHDFRVNNHGEVEGENEETIRPNLLERNQIHPSLDQPGSHEPYDFSAQRNDISVQKPESATSPERTREKESLFLTTNDFEPAIPTSSSPSTNPQSPQYENKQAPESDEAVIENVSNTLRRNTTISRHSTLGGTNTSTSSGQAADMSSLPNFSTMSLQTHDHHEVIPGWLPELPKTDGLSAAIVETFSGELSSSGLLHPSCVGTVYMKYAPKVGEFSKELGVQIASNFSLSIIKRDENFVRASSSNDCFHLATDKLESPLPVLGYTLQLDSVNGTRSIPLTVVQKWKHEDTSSSMIAFIKPNPAWKNLGNTLTIQKLVIIVYLGENILVKSCQSSPAGEFSRKTSKLKLHFSDITVSSSGFKVLARFVVSPNTAIRKPVIGLRFRMNDNTNDAGLVKLFERPELESPASSRRSALESAYEEKKIPTSYTSHIRDCILYPS